MLKELIVKQLIRKQVLYLHFACTCTKALLATQR